MRHLKVVVIKPSKYDEQGNVERFRWGYMPNATVPFVHSMIPESLGNTRIRVEAVDEYVQTDLEYLKLLDAEERGNTLVLLVGVQSHQFQRALDLAAFAVERGCMAVVGGPHPMTCDTTMLQGKGVSFALAEAESVLETILHDAISEGDLKPVYGEGERWARRIDPPVLKIPGPKDQRRYVTNLLGVYPARGCPFVCNFCSVIKIAGRNVRSQPIATTMATLHAAKKAGIKSVFITSDNFNKYADVVELCNAIVDDNLKLRFFVQCDTQIGRQEKLVELFAKAGIFQIFLGVESLSLAALQGVHKTQNRPGEYLKIREICDHYGVNTHFSMINGFPTDTEESILDQLAALIKINPSMASFYTLCPIPGTEQYDDFRAKGLITADNLDRFDTIGLTWRHPNLSARQLHDLFCRCYREFFSFDHWRKYKPHGNQMTKKTIGQYHAFVQWCSRTGDHPMSGGVWRRKVDRVNDYVEYRRKRFGYDIVPLPDSLQLSARDQEYNNKAKIRLVQA